MTMMIAQRWTKWTIAAACVASLGLAGCSGDPYVEPAGAPPTVKKDPFRPDVDAGIRVDAGSIELGDLASNRSYGGVRNDPFAMLPAEGRYDADQRAARLVSESGGFVLIASPPVESVQVLSPMEPQPYRRLSGVLVGDSVHAIIELENGQTVIIRPGSRIPNTEWTVVSIDSDKAVLRRPGNRRPNEIVVRLESPPAGRGGGGGGGGGGVGGGGGAPGGGGNAGGRRGALPGDVGVGGGGGL